MVIRDELEALPGGQTRATLRSRILLGVFADDEAARLSRGATPQQVDAAMTWFRTRFDLLKRTDVEDFMAFASLDLVSLSAQMRTFANIWTVADARASEVDRRLQSFKALLRLEDMRHGREVF